MISGPLIDPTAAQSPPPRALVERRGEGARGARGGGGGIGGTPPPAEMQYIHKELTAKMYHTDPFSIYNCHNV